jgi:hypothetical protein
MESVRIKKATKSNDEERHDEDEQDEQQQRIRQESPRNEGRSHHFRVDNVNALIELGEGLIDEIRLRSGSGIAHTRIVPVLSA